jgi:hypothetical protein
MPMSLSKLFIPMLIGLGVLSGCAATVTTPVSAPAPAPVPAQTPTQQTQASIHNPLPYPDVEVLSYQNISYNFRFNYPNDFSFVTPSYANLEDKIVQIQVPKSTYGNTNFGDADFYVSAVYAKSLQDCLKLNLPEGSTGFVDSDKVSINGVSYYKTAGNGAGAGNFYESKTYRTYHNDFCLEIGQTIHTSNIGNYTPGTVTEVDKNPVWQKLDGIMQSFSLF